MILSRAIFGIWHDADHLMGNHVITSTGGGQIDVGNAFTTNTNAIISGNTIVDGGGIKTGALELGGGKFIVAINIIRNHGSCGIGIGHNVIGATITGNTISNCGRNAAEKNQPQRADLEFTWDMACQTSSFPATDASTISQIKRKLGA